MSQAKGLVCVKYEIGRSLNIRKQLEEGPWPLEAIMKTGLYPQFNGKLLESISMRVA